MVTWRTAVPTRVVGFALIAMAAWIAGCGDGGPEQLYTAAEGASRRAATDSASVGEAVELLGSFLEQYPEHERAPEALKMLAMLVQQSGDMRGAIAHYQRLLSTYPQSECADEAQFMIGFIYEEHLQDFDQARAAYQRVVDEYPGTDLAANAERLLPHVGQPAEEWVKFQDRTASP